MGFYINPKDMPKTQWIREHMIEHVHSTPDPIAREPNHHWVCTVDNGMFLAAGIAFDKQEFDAFAHPDHRRKSWSLVADKDLISVCPEVEKVLKPYA